MASYALLARDYWRVHLRDRYEALDDPDRFFADLGEQIERQVDDLWDQLRARDGGDPHESYVTHVQRLNSLKLQAEEIVLKDLVYIDQSGHED